MARVTTPEVSPTSYTNPHNTDHISSLQYKQRQCHDSINTSNLTATGIEPGPIWVVYHVYWYG